MNYVIVFSTLLLVFTSIMCIYLVGLLNEIRRISEVTKHHTELMHAYLKVFSVTYAKSKDDLINAVNSISEDVDDLKDKADGLTDHIDILHELMNQYTDTILCSVGRSNSSNEFVRDYLDIMKNTILDIYEKMNKPIYGKEEDDTEDTEETDLMPESRYPIPIPMEDGDIKYAD